MLLLSTPLTRPIILLPGIFHSSSHLLLDYFPEFPTPLHTSYYTTSRYLPLHFTRNDTLHSHFQCVYGTTIESALRAKRTHGCLPTRRRSQEEQRGLYRGLCRILSQPRGQPSLKYAFPMQYRPVALQGYQTGFPSRSRKPPP